MSGCSQYNGLRSPWSFSALSICISADSTSNMAVTGESSFWFTMSQISGPLTTQSSCITSSSYA